MSDSVQPTRLPRSWDSPGKNTGVGCHFLLQCMKVKSESEVAQSCPSLRDPMDCSPPGSSVHGIFQARVLEWGAIAFSIWSLEVVAFTKYSTFAVFISPNDFSVPLFWDFNYIYVNMLDTSIAHWHSAFFFPSIFIPSLSFIFHAWYLWCLQEHGSFLLQLRPFTWFFISDVF